MNLKINTPIRHPVLLISLWYILFIGLVSCGIDNYPYLPPVPAGNVSLLELGSGAAIDLPAIDPAYHNYFRSFTFYYRIYLSDYEVPGRVLLDNLITINNSLNTDYLTLQQYTDSDDTRITTVIGSAFSNRNYYTLALENAGIESLLNSTGGATVDLDFADTPGVYPRLILNNDQSSPYNLHRFSETGIMSPRPDRYFYNTSELTNENNISTIDRTNLDIQKKDSYSGPKYAYVSIYVLATGIDDNYSPVYSKPAFVGIFRLPGGPS
jgi:hypothetical protein